MNNSDSVKFVKSFENRLPFITYKGQLCCPVRVLGRALEYGDEGKNLSKLVTGEWKEEFEIGRHYIHLSGKNLREFKELMDEVQSDFTSSDYLKSNKITLLLEPGIDKVLLKTEKPIGVKIREWLASDVMPSIEFSAGTSFV